MTARRDRAEAVAAAGRAVLAAERARLLVRLAELDRVLDIGLTRVVASREAAVFTPPEVR